MCYGHGWVIGEFARGLPAALSDGPIRLPPSPNRSATPAIQLKEPADDLSKDRRDGKESLVFVLKSLACKSLQMRSVAREKAEGGVKLLGHGQARLVCLNLPCIPIQWRTNRERQQLPAM